MDYKNTLNLPRTDFPMKADLVAREPQRLQKWESSRLYERILSPGNNQEVISKDELVQKFDAG